MKETLILYTSALCNLKCTYCYIDKNPILKDIDKKLEESFLDKDYYFNFSKEIFHKESLQEIQFWGGEPSWGLHRIIPILKNFLDYYPNLNGFGMSTNLTLPNWFDEVSNFLNALGNYPRNFTIFFQLSLDGPEYINDITRGKNTTKLFLENYNKLVVELPNIIPKNVTIDLWFKPTLSAETISLLQDKETVRNYFKFFDNLMDQIKNLNHNQINMQTAIPNTACPSPHTVEDGIKFANYCKLCYELSKENTENSYFHNYETITSFVRKNCCTEQHCYFCGGGLISVGLLPEKKISICHNGFTDLMMAYRDLANKVDDTRCVVQELFINNAGIFSACMDLQEFQQYKKMMQDYENINSKAAFNNLVLVIRMLAKNKQIDPKYLNNDEAINAAIFYLGRTANCIRDNMNTSGSILIPPVGLIKLLFNGAKEYIDATEQLL